MKNRVVRAVFAAAAVLGCGSVGAGTPASAYVQDGLVAQFDGIEHYQGSELIDIVALT